jgi:NADP-dependent 3-hydroxy acid dehydrogenase YdfG
VTLGIGRATAERCAKRGARVIMADFRPKPGMRLRDTIGMARLSAWLVGDDADYVRGVIHTR